MKNLLNKKEYFAWEWPGFYWYQGLAPAQAWFYDFAKYGCALNTIAITFGEGVEAYYFLRDEYTKAGAIFFEKIKQDPKIINDVLKEIEALSNRIFKLGYWQKIDFTKENNKSLLNYHKQLFSIDNLLWRRGQIPNILELSNSYLTDYVKELIKNKFGQRQINKIFTVLTTSRYLSKAEESEQELANLATLRLSTRKINTRLASYFYKYCWMTYGWSGPSLSKEYFYQQFLFFKHNRQRAILNKRFLEKNRTIQAQALILKRFNAEERIFLIMLRKILESKAKRVDAHSLTYFLAEKLMVEIGKRVGLSLNQMRVVSPNEVPGLFKKVNLDLINQRYKRILFVFKRPHIFEYTGNSAEKKLKSIQRLLPNIVASNELQGEFAYPGRVKGVVKIILDLKDSPKFRSGDILITRMTDPNYLQIMKKSKAIVTDIGGITCHAAIVSRELRKPCIVGTQFATQAFKDGDLVEVDANKGIVRKITK